MWLAIKSVFCNRFSRWEKTTSLFPHLLHAYAIVLAKSSAAMPVSMLTVSAVLNAVVQEGVYQERVLIFVII